LTVELADEKQLQTPPDVCRELRNAAWQERRDALVVSPQGHPLRRAREPARRHQRRSRGLRWSTKHQMAFGSWACWPALRIGYRTTRLRLSKCQGSDWAFSRCQRCGKA